MSSQPLIQLPHAERGRAQGAMYAFYGVSRHFAQPEGFLLIGGYLTVTWLFKMLPSSYYVLEAPTLDGTRFVNVLAQVSACLCGTQVLLLLITNSPILPPSVHTDLPLFPRLCIVAASRRRLPAVGRAPAGARHQAALHARARAPPQVALPLLIRSLGRVHD